MHNDAYGISKKYGKDAFYLIYYLGTSCMPFFIELNQVRKLLKTLNSSLTKP